MARIVLTTIGSGGDAFPFVPVGHALGARGHTVELAAPPPVVHVLRDAGLSVRPIGPFVGRQAIRTAGGFDHRLRGYLGFDRFWRLVLDGLPRTVDDLRALVRGADLVVAHVFHPAAVIAAAAENVPFATLDLHPCFLPTRSAPPPGLPSWGPANQPMWALLRAVWRHRIDRRINDERVRAGLAPIRDAGLLGGVSDRLCLSLADERYTPVRSDWPPSVRSVGFPRWDTPARLGHMADDRELSAFLDVGAPPIVLTLGTALPMDPGSFYDHARAALERLPDHRAVILGAPDLALPPALASRVLLRPYVPLSSLLPRASAVVHHGGVGTTHAAIAAGCPAVVVPRCYDQRYHAARVEALGIGRALPWARVTGERLAAAIRAVDADDAGRQAVRRLAAQLADRQPATEAADALEALVVTT
jgi:rhamnosyltransferase subunit B